MDTSFADWYHIVHLEVQEETLKKRWKIIEQLANQTLDAKYIFDLLCLFYNLPNKDNDSVEELVSKFKESDVAFLMRDNEVELQVLVGSLLACVLKKEPSNTTDIVALSLICSYFSQKTNNTFIQDIVKRADQYLFSEAIRIRTISSLPEIKTPQINLDSNLNNWPKTISQFSELTNVITSISSNLNTTKSSVSTIFSILQEQSNILWWLMGEWSNDLKCHISKLPYPCVSIVSAIELADLTKFKPGPVATPSFLEKMLRLANKDTPDIKLQDAINECPSKWKESISKKLHLEERINSQKAFIFPILFALQKSLETNDKETWLSNVTKVTNVDTKLPIGAKDLSFQIYQENMLLDMI